MQQQLNLNVFRNVCGTVARHERGVNHTSFGGRAGSLLPHVLLPVILLVAVPAQIGVAAEADSENPTKSGWVTPKRFKHMAPHPRLFVSQAQIDRMVNPSPPKSPIPARLESNRRA